MRRPAASSSLWLSYFAQPLKRHFVAATSPRRFLHEERAEIARPHAVGGAFEEFDGVHRAPTLRSTLRAWRSCDAPFDQDAHLLDAASLRTISP